MFEEAINKLNNCDNPTNKQDQIEIIKKLFLDKDVILCSEIVYNSIGKRND